MTERRDGIAVIGMAGRFPGAANVAELWRLLVAGEEAIRFFTREELLAAGTPGAVLDDPRFVPAAGVVDGCELFDAEFFGYSPREAQAIDPQQRLLLECAWEALEFSGHDAAQETGSIGIFAGVSENTYLVNLYSNREFLAAMDGFQLGVANDKDFAALRAAYKLGLKGPAYTIQTTCSTSLAAVHLACQSLLTHECDFALAGAASIGVPQIAGYVYQEGSLVSPDGHCRAFDARAAGTVAGHGVGMVVLRRLEDALRDGDTVYAVILASAVANDGDDKVGFTAPSLSGVRQAASLSYALAGIEVESLGYLEAHGTATPLGDPIEVAALSAAFREHTSARGFCGLGSIKSNLGHLDAAAGVAALIKTALALHHGEIPASLHFERPNPRLNLEKSPFFVVDRRRSWPRCGSPRRAAVNGMGFGGTNVHLVLEEGPSPPPSAPPADSPQLLLLSARTPSALEASSDRLAAWLEEHPEVALADLAFTLEAGRRVLPERRFLVARSLAEAQQALLTRDPERLRGARAPSGTVSVVLLLPGLGDQHVGMAADLYHQQPVFRRELDRVAELFAAELGEDPRGWLLAPREVPQTSGLDLRRLVAGPREPAPSEATRAHPALFALEYALARQWMEWGVEPEALLGYSLGELVAAALAEVLPLPALVALVAARARLISAQGPGAMLAIARAAESIELPAGSGLAVAALLGPELSVVAGPKASIEALATELGNTGVVCRRLAAEQAFHHPALAVAGGELTRLASSWSPRPPRIPYFSCQTGAWITTHEVTDAGYWARQMASPVRFASCWEQLLPERDALLLEVGPGQALGSWALQHPAAQRAKGLRVVASLPGPSDGRAVAETLARARGELWLAGVQLDARRVWAGHEGGASPRRLVLPTYPFERQRFWVDPVGAPAFGLAPQAPVLTAEDTFRPGLALPLWRQLPPTGGRAESPGHWWVIGDADGLGRALVERLERLGGRATLASDGENPPSDLTGCVWLKGLEAPSVERSPSVDHIPEHLPAWFSLTGRLASRAGTGGFEMVQLVAGTQAARGDEVLDPWAALALAVSWVVPIEYPGVSTRVIDLGGEGWAGEVDLETVVAELSAGREPLVALRGRRRFARAFVSTPLRRQPEAGPWRPGGFYWITGGLGGFGLALARHLARRCQARLLLTGRTEVLLPSQLEALREIEALGGEVLALAADCADEPALGCALAAGEQRFGPLVGLIHAAGDVAPESYTTLATTGATELARQLRAKVWGTERLARVLAGRPLDFRLLISSVAAQLGGLGFGAYAAANLFLDTFAQAAPPAERWISLNLDPFEVDESAPAAPPGGPAILSVEQLLGGIEQALSSPFEPQLALLAADLEARRRQWGGAAAAGNHPNKAAGRRQSTLGEPAPAEGDLEVVVTELWEQVLGVSPVGALDDFFALGGDSLLGTRLFARLREVFGIELALPTLFSLRTVRALGRALVAAEPKPGQAATVARVRRRVMSLAPQEVERWLAERRP